MNAISRSSEYAIRAMTYLATRPPGEYQLARRMAETLTIPAPFLGKVLQPMVGIGLLESQRGRSGGFRLAKRPTDITLYEIVDGLEHVAHRHACFLGQAECSDERACPMHGFWKVVHEDYVRRLSGTTLQDLVEFCEARPESGYPLVAAPQLDPLA